MPHAVQLTTNQNIVFAIASRVRDTTIRLVNLPRRRERPPFTEC
jgi:hypothetical protein